MTKARQTPGAIGFRRLASTILLVLTTGGLDCPAQTNDAQPTAETTNNVPDQTGSFPGGTNAESIIDARLALIRQTMPGSVESRRDEVEDRLSLYTMDRELRDTDTTSLTASLITFLHGHQTLPQTVYLHLTGQSKTARFKYSHDVTIRYDDMVFSPKILTYETGTSSDGDVLENIYPELTLAQLHDLAFAKTVFFKLALDNHEITFDQRQSWRLFWTYLDLNRARLDAQAGKFGPLPPLTREETDFQAAAKAKTDLRTAVLNRVLQSNQKAAARGDAYGLLRMGERYRDGESVDKDLGKAREYLQKAADAGSLTASNELSVLPSPSK